MGRVFYYIVTHGCDRRIYLVVAIFEKECTHKSRTMQARRRTEYRNVRLGLLFDEWYGF